jgi:hypothetical protein
MDDLVQLCCTHGELRTLQRTLAAGGPRCACTGSKITLHRQQSSRSLCRLACSMPEGCCSPQRTDAACCAARGRAALEGLCERLQQEAGGPDAVAALPLEDRLQFVQRCHLAMRRHDEAGKALRLPCMLCRSYMEQQEED